MNDANVIDVLNELLAGEARSLLLRLGESTMSVSWASAEELRIVSRLADEESEHRAWLVEAICDLGGDPMPAVADIQSANVHFLDLSFVLPRVLADRKRMLAVYEAATLEIAANARAAAVIARITERLRKHVARLSDLTARTRSHAV